MVPPSKSNQRTETICNWQLPSYQTPRATGAIYSSCTGDVRVTRFSKWLSTCSHENFSLFKIVSRLTERLYCTTTKHFKIIVIIWLIFWGWQWSSCQKWNKTQPDFLGFVSLRKSKIGFFNTKESENGFCVSLINRSIQDLWGRSASKERSNLLWQWILRFLWRTMIREILAIDLFSTETQNAFSSNLGFS